MVVVSKTVYKNLFRKVLTCAIIVIVVLLSLDLACSFVWGPEDEFQALAFPPSQTISYEARNFQFTSKTNNLGFRGPYFSVKRSPDVARVLVLGNSYVYGWGLDFEFTWPHLLQEELRKTGKKVEIANLATPGTSPYRMIDIAKRAIPILKPDLVVIAVLQGAGLITFKGEEQPDKTQVKEQTDKIQLKDHLIGKIKFLLPNTVRAMQVLKSELTSTTVTPAERIRHQWQLQVNKFLKAMTPTQRKRYDQLQAEVRNQFESAQMNPELIVSSVKNPDLFINTIKLKKVIDAGRRDMKKMFMRIKSISESSGAKVLVVSMPYAAYLQREAAGIPASVGFNIPPFLENNLSSDKIIHSVATEADLPSISVIREFQKVVAGGRSASFFIPFDGHYNVKGAKTYATLLLKKFGEALTEAQLKANK